MFKPTRVVDSAFWIVHKADENPAIRMHLIPQDVDRKLVSYSLWTIPLPGYFGFDNDLFSLEEKIHSRRRARIARGPLFSSNVIEHPYQEGAKEILEIVLIVDLQSRTVRMPPLQFLKDERKSSAYGLNLKGRRWRDGELLLLQGQGEDVTLIQDIRLEGCAERI
jgi:hypothetical protein